MRCGVERLAGARGDGVAQRCVGCEHAVVAMAMTPWRRDQGGEPIEELAHREALSAQRRYADGVDFGEDETVSRVGGAKGRAEQGSRRRDR